MKTKSPIFQLIVFVLTFSTIPSYTFAQNPTNKEANDKEQRENADNSQKSLQGLTEAILIDGQPTLRIQLMNNVASDVKLVKRDGEESLAFNVIKIYNSVGILYVTKNALTYMPNDKPNEFFKIEKSKIKEINLRESFRLGRNYSNVQIEFEEGDKRFSLGIPSKGNKQVLLSANDYLFRAIKDFDNAIKEFNQLTASVRPKEEDEAVAEEDSESDITSKYDRFKDITFVVTSKLLIKGNKRSIRAYAEYSFTGKSQQKPEKVTLYFYASAPRPLFREDDLELNFLVDDKRLPFGKMRVVDEETTKTVTKQTLSITMPYENFEQIANSKKSEFQIGILEFKFSDFHLEAFRKLLEYRISETQ